MAGDRESGIQRREWRTYVQRLVGLDWILIVYGQINWRRARDWCVVLGSLDCVSHTMASSLSGQIGEFGDGDSDFGEYLERFEQFLAANAITSVPRKRAVFLSVCGSKVYSVLRSILAPDLPATKTYGELAEAAWKHFAPRPAVIVSRYKFNRAAQQAGQTVSVFLAELRRIARDCAYGDRLDEQLRDRFVCGIRSGAMLKRLLQEGDSLSLDSAVKIATAMETAAADLQEIGTASPPAQQISPPAGPDPLHASARRRQR